MKKAMKSDMTCSVGSCGPSCIFYGLLAALFFAGGIYFVVQGYVQQVGGEAWTVSGLSYFLGFIIMGFGKCMKMKACGYCR